jgi:UDP-N-acetylglucosamine acyltransferase
LANGVSLAGHVEIDDFVVLGGLTGIHQFCKLGAHSITMGGTLLSQDVPPYVRAVSRGGNAFPNGINSEGLKRRGFSAQAILDIKKGYKIIYMKDNSIDDAKKDLIKLKESSEEVELYIDFIERSKRGLIRSSG